MRPRFLDGLYSLGNSAAVKGKPHGLRTVSARGRATAPHSSAERYRGAPPLDGIIEAVHEHRTNARRYTTLIDCFAFRDIDQICDYSAFGAIIFTCLPHVGATQEPSRVVRTMTAPCSDWPRSMVVMKRARRFLSALQEVMEPTRSQD
jgi:hypothetical protein